MGRTQNLNIGMWLALALLLVHAVVAENRCGESYADAAGMCGVLCPGGVDSECSSGETCFGQLDSCSSPPKLPTSATENRCGDGYSDAVGKCGTKCPGGVDSECPAGESCFDQLDSCGTSFPPTGPGRCGSGSDPAIRCINAHNNCAGSCSSNADCTDGGTCEEASSSCTDSTPAGTLYSEFNSEQVSNARIIIGVGKGANFPQRGWEVALVTAMQESFLLNIGCGDQDSVGLFQQRNEYGWGTFAQIQNPVLSSEAFYGVADHTSNRGLVNIPGWESMTVGQAAQEVQVAEAGNQYEKWASLAQEIVSNNADAPLISG